MCTVAVHSGDNQSQMLSCSVKPDQREAEYWPIHKATDILPPLTAILHFAKLATTCS